nr:reverse transcriptase domain-containing protein [Tanacetum cinerariifolium]
VSDDALRLSLFPYSLTHHAIAWYDRLPRNSIHTFEDMMRKFLSKYFPLSMVTKLRNEITDFRQKPNESLFKAWEHYKLSIDRCPKHNMLLVTKIDMFYNGLTLRHQDTIKAAAGGTFMQKTPEECYDLIENMTAHHNHWDTFATRDDTSRTISSTTTNESPKVVQQLEMMNKNFQEMMKQMQPMQMQQTSSSRSLLNNTVANPRGELKAITTRSGVTCDGPMIPPTPSPLLEEVEHEIKTIKDKVQPTSSESTAHVQPPVIQIPIPEPEVASKTNPKLSIPYPSRLNDQKLYEKSNNQMMKFLQIFQRLHFDISFVDSLLHMLNFSSTFKSLLSNKEKLFELASTPLNENCSEVNVIDVACRQYAQEVLEFLYSSTSGNPTPSDPIITSSSPSFTLFEGSDFILEEIETFLRTPNELTNLDDDYYDTEGDILYLEKLLNEDPSPNLPSMKNEDLKCMMAIFHDMIKETMEVFMDDFLIFEDSFSSCLSHLDKMLKGCEDTNLVLNWEKCHFIVKEGIVLGHKISKSEIEIDRAKVDVIAKLPHSTSVKGVRSFLGHAGLYRRFIQDYSKISQPMTYLLEKESPFIFSKECIEAFNMLKKKLTEALVLVAPNWDLPFEIMYDTSDYANLAANHLSRLENPHEGDLEKKEIKEEFPLETLGMISFSGDSSTSCDRGTHPFNDKFAKVILKYGVTCRLSTVYHPQTRGQVKVLNRGMKCILERTIGENRASWSDKLDDALWAFRTAFKTPIGCTPYKLVYEKACHLPIELEHKACWALKHCNFNLKTVVNHQKVQMNKLMNSEINLARTL